MKLIQIAIGAHATLTGYLHEKSGEMANIQAYPAMLVIPGGGFRFCSDREGEPVAMAYFAEGYQAFVLDYTTVTKKPDATIEDPMRDAVEALRIIRANAEEYLLNPHKVAMIGFSGGGHLAAAVATHFEERPDVLLLGYPGIVHSDLRALDCPDIPDRVDQNTPSSFIFGTRNDTVVPPVHLLTFATALNQAGVDFELHIFKDGVHGLSLATSLTSNGSASNINPVFNAWFPMSVRWLKDQLGDFTIYGVNDGRYGKFSIDKPLGLILEDPQAAAILNEILPMLPAAAEKSPFMKEITIRQIAGMMPGMDGEKLALLDERLLALG